LCLLHWHSHSHHGSGDPEVDAAVAAILTVAVLVMGTGVGFLLAGLLQGGLLLPWVSKKRHLFWAVPVLNVGWYFLARACLLSDTSPLAQVVVGVPLASLCGLLSAVLLAPFHVLIWRLSRRASAAPAPTDGRTAEQLAPSVIVNPLPVDEPPAAAFRHGWAAPWEGFGYLCQHPRLWWHGVLPVVLNVLITGVVLLLLLVVAVWFVASLHPLFPAGWGWLALEVLCAVGFLVLAVGLALVAWSLLQGVLCGHYLAKLACAVEIQLGLPPDQIQEVSWGYQVVDACRDVAALVAINGGFLLLHVLPGIGSVLGVAGSLYYDWLLFGAEYFDYPLALRGKRRDEKKQFIRRHRYYTLGLGAAVFLANFIPVVGAVLLATAVVGAVLLHRRLEAPPAIASAAAPAPPPSTANPSASRL
jgi:CysZ protein